MDEGIANHFSLRIKGDGNSFLMNQNKQHFSRIRASDLICWILISLQKLTIQILRIQLPGVCMAQFIVIVSMPTA